MKKLIVGLFIFGFIAISAPQVHASILSDALLKIQNLQKEVSSLKSKLGAYALGYTPSSTNLDNSTSSGSSTSSGFSLSTVGDGCSSSTIYSYTTGAKCPNVAAPITPTTDGTPRISYWSGKVNQHVDLSAQMWQTDADGVSGADIDKLTYCKKWYPKTTSVVEYKNETINAWHDAGNINDYQNTRMSYRCAEPTIDLGCSNGQVYSSTTGAKCLNNATPSLTVLSPIGGETYNAGDKVTVKWKSIGYSSNSKISIDLAATDSNGSSTNTHLMSVSSLDDDGVETLTIPSSVKTGSNYVLMLTIFETSTKWQMAKSNLFTINSTPTPVTPLSASIEVISPNNGGESVEVGGKVEIRWETNVIGAVVDVYISDGINKGDVIKGTNGSVIYSIGNKLPPGSNYRIFASLSPSGYSLADMSDNYFTIKPATTVIDMGCQSGAKFSSTTGQACPAAYPVVNTIAVKIYSPKEGDIFRQGLFNTISWTGGKESVNVALVKDDFTTRYGNILGWLKQDGKPNDKVEWDGAKVESLGSSTLNNVLPGKYKILIYSKNENGINCFGVSAENDCNYDLSGVFTIKPASVVDQGCQAGAVYSYTTGSKCPTPTVIDMGCQGGALYSNTTGQSCQVDNNITTTPITRTLKQGLIGDDVKTLQEFLGVNPDGVYGRGTASKVKEWQTSQGLYADGVFGNTSYQTSGLE